QVIRALVDRLESLEQEVQTLRDQLEHVEKPQYAVVVGDRHSSFMNIEHHNIEHHNTEHHSEAPLSTCLLSDKAIEQFLDGSGI
ncbi:MAG: hypothetical protein WBA57_23735, partial [Elainellaceae cyanobacterium]